MYLVKLNIALVVFYAFYKLLISRDTFFVWRRVMLLAMIMLSIIIPLVDFADCIEGNNAIQSMIQTYKLPEVLAVQAGSLRNVWSDNLSNISFLIALLYCVVTMALLARMVMQLCSIVSLIKHSNRRMLQGVSVRVLNEEIAPFSFFKWIFINPKLHKQNELSEILEHEKAHVCQWHSVDVLFSEMACIAMWYNPFVWLLKREVRSNLEYLADNRVLKEGYDRKNYQYHLLGLTYQKAAAKLYNNFNVLPLKQRIEMMNKKRTNEMSKAKYFLLLPLVVILVTGSNIGIMAQTTDVSIEKTKSGVYKVVEQMPEFPGGMVALNNWIRTNLTYPALAMEDNVQGTVVAQFVVKADGSIADVEIVRGVHPLLDAESIRLLKSLPKFEPGRIQGTPVDVYFTIPLRFVLTGDKNEKITITRQKELGSE